MPHDNLTDLTQLSDTELMDATHQAWVTGLVHNTFRAVRACQAEAHRRGNSALYDNTYAKFWAAIAAGGQRAA